jgi:hypothetical protein
MSESFARLQHWLVEQMLSRRGLDRDPNVVEQAAKHLTGNDRLLPVDQLEIYRQQFWLRHTASLVEDFPGVGGILGQEQWEPLVESYLERSHPLGWTLRDLGRHFPEHIATAEVSHRELCHDMARLEWCFIELFDAPDSAPLDLAKLAALPPGAIEQARFRLNPALRQLEVDYPVAQLRLTLLDKNQHEPVAIPEREHQYLVLYRGSNRRLYHHPTSHEAFVLLHELSQGEPLLLACEKTLQRLPHAAERLEQGVGAWFQDWVRRGWIVDLTPA